MANEVIKMELLEVKAKSDTKPKPMRLHQIAMQVNILVEKVEKLSKRNKELITEVKELKRTK